MKQRVLIFATTYFPLVGGAEVAMREVTNRLPDFDFDLICARVQPGLASTERIGNITVHRVGFGHPFDKYLLPLLGPIKALFLGRAPRPAPRAPIIWSLMASYGGFAALVYTWIRPRTKMLLTLQEGDPLEHYAKRVGALKFLHEKIFARADVVQSISRFLADWARKMGFKGEPMIVPNGVDVEKFSRKLPVGGREELRKSFGFSESDVVLVTASRLSLKNGIDDLIRSLTSLPPNIKCLIAGDGEDAEKLRVLTEKKGLANRVVFLGSRSHDELPGILQASDIFVRASLSEGLGNSFLEAMAAGIPIIGTPVGGIPDFLTDGETGVFCQPRDPESIAAAVRRIQEEPGLRERLIANGERLVRAQYDWNGIAERIHGVLASLVEIPSNTLPAKGVRSCIRAHRWGIAFAIFFGLLMALPYIIFPWQIGDSYHGIGRIIADDTFFYLARIRDAMDGYLNLASPYLWEHKAGLPHQLFFVEDALGLFYRALRLDILSGFILTTGIASALVALLTYAIAYTISHSSKRAVLLTAFLFIGLFPLAFFRPISPQTNMLFWLAQIYILLLCAVKPMTARLVAANALAFGLLFYVYPYYWMHLAVVYVLFIAYLWFADRARAKLIGLSVIGGSVLAIPYLVLNYMESRLPEFGEIVVRMGMVQTHMPGSLDVLMSVGICVIVSALLWKEGIRPMIGTIFLAISTVSVAIATNQQVITGRDVFFSSHFRDIGIFSSAFLLIALAPAIFARMKHPRRWLIGTVVMMLVVIGGGMKAYAVTIVSVSEQSMRMQAYGPVIDWLNAHAPKDAVVYANEELSQVIPVYTSANIFFSNQINLSLVSDAESMRRFVYNNYFASFTPEMIAKNERSVFTLRYIAQAGKMRQGNKLRRLLGMDPIPFEVLPEERVQDATRKANEIRQSSDVSAAWREFRVDYILWDRLIDSEWAFKDRTDLAPVYQDDRFTIYTIL